MNHNTRIQLTDTAQDMLMKLCEGNPGALNVLIKLFTETELIDPDAAFGPYSAILALDTLGIYGPHIWVLFKDVCGEDIVNMVAVLRANQLGFVDDDLVVHSCSDRSRHSVGAIDAPHLLELVKERLPNFGKQLQPV
jgi:hypothetical protein